MRILITEAIKDSIEFDQWYQGFMGKLRKELSGGSSTARLHKQGYRFDPNSGSFWIPTEYQGKRFYVVLDGTQQEPHYEPHVVYIPVLEQLKDTSDAIGVVEKQKKQLQWMVLSLFGEKTKQEVFESIKTHFVKLVKDEVEKKLGGKKMDTKVLVNAVYTLRDEEGFVTDFHEKLDFELSLRHIRLTDEENTSMIAQIRELYWGLVKDYSL